MSIESERRRFYGGREGNKEVELLLKENDKLIRENGKLIDENIRLSHIVEAPHPTRLAIIKIINNSKFEIMALTLPLAANQSDLGSFALIDNVNNQPVTGTFASPTASSDNEAVATASFDANGNPQAVAVAAGTANLTYNASATYTNSLGVVVTEQKTVVYAVTITAVVTADGTTLVINWAPPTTQQAPPPPPLSAKK